MSVPYVQLNNGLKMPIIGLGTSSHGFEDVEEAIKIAVKNGYRHIDCAHIYGNEKEIGKALKELIDTKIVQREELFITSKLWNDKHDPKLVRKACELSLKHLQLNYLDLYLIHWPCGYSGSLNDCNYVKTWKAMEELVRDGLVKSIGVSNFNSEQITRLLDNCSIKPVTNQIEVHPYLNQKKLRDFCCERDIFITAYSPLGSPNALQPSSKRDSFIINNDLIKEIAKKYQKTPSQIILRYLIDIGVAPIPKSFNADRMKKNIDIFDFKLTDEDITKIDQLDRNERICPAEELQDHKNYPFNIAF